MTTTVSPSTGLSTTDSTFSTRFWPLTVARARNRPSRAIVKVEPLIATLSAIAALTMPCGLVQRSCWYAAGPVWVAVPCG